MQTSWRVKDPLELEDIDNLLSYLVVVGLKSNELINYLFNNIHIAKTEFTTELLRTNVIAFHSKKSNKSAVRAKVAKAAEPKKKNNKNKDKKEVTSQ